MTAYEAPGGRNVSKVEVTITPISGAVDPPPIGITIKRGRKAWVRVEMTAEDFALAVTGRLVHAEITGGGILDRE